MYGGVLLCMATLPAPPTSMAQVPETLTAARHPVTLLRGVRPPSHEPAQRVYYALTSGDERELIELRARLVDAGARQISTFLPDVMVCDVPLRVDPWSVLEGKRGTASTASRISRTSPSPLPSNRAWIKRAYDMTDARAGAPESFPPRVPVGVPEISNTDTGGRTDRNSTAKARAPAEGDDRLPHQNSEFLAGHVLIQVVFPESRGSAEDWTDDAVTEASVLIRGATAYFEQYFRNVSVEFSYRFIENVDTQYEPINDSYNIDAVETWVTDVMDHMGYREYDTVDEQVTAFNNAGRKSYRSDWVFTVFVVNSANDEDHRFDGSRKDVYAKLGGPYMALPYPPPAGWLGERATFEQWFKHGMVQVFWALTEDTGSAWSCDDHSGYLDIRHGNKNIEGAGGAVIVNCDGEFPAACVANFFLVDAGYSGPPCEFSYGHMGDFDGDGNDVPDIFDAAPDIVFHGAAAETVFTLEHPMQFDVMCRATPNKNSQQSKLGLPQRDYATAIKDVSYTMNGIGPVYKYPVDGEADELVEEYEISLQHILPGLTTFVITARNVFAAKSPPATKDITYIGLSYYNFDFDHKNDGVGVVWSLRGQTFGAQLELHRIDYSAQVPIDTVVATADHLQPVKPPHSGTTPYYYLDRSVTPAHDYGYYVVGSFVVSYRGVDTTVTSVSEEYRTVAPIPRAGGILSVPVPNPFQPTTASRDLVVSVSVPGARGTPLLLTSRVTGADGLNGIPEPIALSVRVYDVAGRWVKDLFNERVYDEVVPVRWDGTDGSGELVPSGMYFIMARVGDVTDSQKVLVIR
jgi:hypothetical protein